MFSQVEAPEEENEEAVKEYKQNEDVNQEMDSTLKTEKWRQSEDAKEQQLWLYRKLHKLHNTFSNYAFSAFICS